MQEQIHIGDFVQYEKGGRSYHLKGQVKQKYSDNTIRVVLIPECHQLYWRISDVKKM